MISHADEIDTTVNTHGNETAVEVLRKSQKPVLFSLHGVACNRIKAAEIYKKIREHFLIIAVDHRGRYTITIIWKYSVNKPDVT